jgi:alpha-1,3-mannosyltransferase
VEAAMAVVTHVVRQFLPNRGGVEDIVLNLALGQAQLGWDVRIVTLNRLFRDLLTHLPDRDEIAGLPVTRIPFSGSTRYPIAPHVLSHISDSDIVHVHWIEFFYDFLAITKPLHRKKLIATTHGGYFHTSFASRLKRVYFPTVTRLSTMAYGKIVASSSSDAEMFRQLTPRVVTIENGVNVAKFSGCAAREHSKTIIHFGRLASNKRIPLLLDLLATLRQISPDWTLIIAGTEFEETISGLTEHSMKLGVENAVQFVSSPSDANLAQIIGKASYFASLSAYEGFGISVVEAMAAGLVPILSAIPPFREFVRRAGAGLIVDANDLVSAAQAIVAFDLTRPTKDRSKLIEAAGKYAWPGVTEAYLAEYENILSASPLQK